MTTANVSNPPSPTPPAPSGRPGSAPVIPLWPLLKGTPTLSAQKAAPATAAAPATPGTPARSADRPKSSPQTQILRNSSQYGVLVVSRRKEVVANVEDLLLRGGETVFLAKDLRDAWDNINLGRIGLVVMDCCQPGAEELVLLSTVRSAPHTADVSFLFLKTKGTAVPLLPIEGDDRYHDAWLDFPCTLEELAVLVTRLLQQRAYSRRLKAQSHPASASSQRMAATDAAAHTGGVSGAMPGILHGKLGELDVPMLLGMLAGMNITGVLTVRSDNKRKGEIHLVNGAVWHATFAGVKGTDALTILLRITKGKFNFDVSEPPEQRTITGNTMGLLLESMREHDETKALVKRASGSGASPGA